ncbi:MAG TPA: serine/threonine-protein kinase [Vicinamibacteria bacterium]|nr:serine/threonine-protein kinase [Vicinamibacteria bacterium]
MDRERIGKYRIVGELGSGTMGEVHKAHDTVLNRYVALKTLGVRALPGDETLQRFHREAQAAALLNHPNIVTVHDFGEEGGILYMAMELLEGTDLRNAIDAGLLKTLDEKLDVMDGVLAALDYAHAKGVVHRDVKPANVHLGPGRQVKIMDFGLARVSSSEMTHEGIVLGTPNYMSPEQALGDKVDGRTDLFSAGAVLYEMLTGHKPFEADSTPSVLFQVVHKEPPPVRRWLPDAPPGIVAIVNRALEKDRAKRFALAGDMRAAIVVTRRTLATSPPALPSRPARPAPPPRPTPPPLPPGAAASVAPDDFAAPAPPAPPRPRVPTPRPMASPPSLRTSPPDGPSASTPPVVAAGRRLRASVLLGAGLAAALVVTLAGLAIAYWLTRRPSLPVSRSPAGSATVDALTQALVSKQVRLAQRELDEKNYPAAATEAEGALKLAPAQPEAKAVLDTAHERMKELDQSVAEARRLLDAGDTGGASRELSHVLELDPRHPAAAELSARLNGVFRAQADEAAAAARAGRAAALAAGASPEALRSADEGTRRSEDLMARGEFADATRLYLEARDGFSRARRDALGRAAPAAATATRTAAASEAAPRPSTGAGLRPGTGRAEETSPAPPPSTPSPARAFVAEGTTIATPTASGIEGFDTSDVSSHRPPQFAGRVEFEVLPPAVRPGDPFVVRIHLRNDGRRVVKVHGLSLAAVVDGQRVPAPVKPLQREVPAQSRALVAEYSGVWAEARSWALEAVLTADRDETVTSRLRAN